MLHCAASHGQEKGVNILVESGANINASDKVSLCVEYDPYSVFCIPCAIVFLRVEKDKQKQYPRIPAPLPQHTVPLLLYYL